MPSMPGCAHAYTAAAVTLLLPHLPAGTLRPALQYNRCASYCDRVRRLRQHIIHCQLEAAQAGAGQPAAANQLAGHKASARQLCLLL